MGNKFIIGAVVLALILIGWARYVSDSSGDAAAAANSANGASEIIATNGIHWHPEISIFIRGEEIEVPANIGLVDGHNPMHTHEPDGVIHLEFSSIVRTSDIRLGRFFELWGKEFNENQIFEYTNNGEERVRMFVNGEPNTEFEEYLLQHEDEIVIRYE